MTDMIRPVPPPYLLSTDLEDAEVEPRFAPDLYAPAWITETFLSEPSPLYNPDHDHLQQADIGWLWTNADNRTRGRVVAGTAEIVMPKGNRWQIARQKQQFFDWFGRIPDFVITISAIITEGINDASFCALIEHELSHCAQEYKDGSPRFSKATGLPLWTLKSHDVEEFVGVVRRYGPDATGVRQMIEAANQWQYERIFSDEAISLACGSCSVGAK